MCRGNILSGKIHDKELALSVSTFEECDCRISIVKILLEFLAHVKDRCDTSCLEGF